MPEPRDVPTSSAAPRSSGELTKDLRAQTRQPTLSERIASDFTYHPPRDGQQEKYLELRERAKHLAQGIAELVPPGREQSSALTRLEEAVMHANAGIARHG